MLVSYELNRDRSIHPYLSRSKSHVCEIHFHKKVEVLYVLSGTINITINNAKYTLQKDNFAICDSYDFHTYEKSKNGGLQSVIIFPHHMLSNYFEFMKDKRLMENVISDTNFCKSIFPLLDDILIGKEESLYLLQSQADYLLGMITKKTGTIPREIIAAPSFIENILVYIDEHLAEEISLSSLAAHFGYSKYYFSRLFNANFQTNLNDYLSVLRLQKTMDTLKKGDCSITNAALSCGFSSMKTFYRVLRKNYGDIKL